MPSSNSKVELLGYNIIQTVAGDTFDRLAFEFYTNEKMASLIIQANPDYCDVLIFDAGVRLKIPVVNIVNPPESLPPWRRGE